MCEWNWWYAIEKGAFLIFPLVANIKRKREVVDAMKWEMGIGLNTKNMWRIRTLSILDLPLYGDEPFGGKFMG